MDQIAYLIAGLMLGWLTLAVGHLLYRRARTWWNVQRYGTPLDHTGLLGEFGRKMSGAQDRKTLGQLFAAELPRALQVERSMLLLPEAYDLIPIEAGESCLRVPISHAAVRWVASAGEAQRADQGQLNELIRQGRDGLSWAQVWVPLMRGTVLHGLWLLGPRGNKLHYSPRDLDWLTAIGRQAAMVLETLRYAEQERQTASGIRALYRQVVTAQEVERGRLARELHDGLLQDLCAVTRDLKSLEAQPDTALPRLPDLATRSGEMVQALRAICNDLRPPLLQHDLISALRGLVEQLDKRTVQPIYIQIEAAELRLPDDAALAIFRITQEALHNAIQHADASEIAVRLTQYPDRLRLTVTDDGRGIEGGVEPARFVSQGHFGLAGMHERAAMIGGQLKVQTAVDYGTVLVLELPQ